MVRRVISTSPAAKILVVACGSAADVRQNMAEIAATEARIVLNDIDDGALAFCKTELSSVVTHCEFVRGNALSNITKLARLGPFDLILCGGLFDYLTDKQIPFFLQKAYEKLLAPKGMLFFTNIADGNPFRTMIEHFGAWYLRERTQDEIRQLTEVVPRRCNVVDPTDGSGLAHLVEFRLT